jgi:hypothetical protein
VRSDEPNAARSVPSSGHLSAGTAGCAIARLAQDHIAAVALLVQAGVPIFRLTKLLIDGVACARSEFERVVWALAGWEAAMRTVERTIRIQVRKYRDSDLLLATSDDLRGLNVIGRSDSEIKEKVPGSVREMLEAQGHRVRSVETQLPNGSEGFIVRDLVASAELELT